MNTNELPIQEREQAIEVLKDFELVFTDLDQPNIRIWKFEETGKLVGIGGLEIFGNRALLRSVAVRKEFQGQKAGMFICKWIENWAVKNQINELYLLTTTAPDFFAHLNYKIIQRDEFPEQLKKTAQFSELCPASAVCMRKEL